MDVCLLGQLLNSLHVSCVLLGFSFNMDAIVILICLFYSAASLPLVNPQLMRATVVAGLMVGAIYRVDSR